MSALHMLDQNQWEPDFFGLNKLSNFMWKDRPAFVAYVLAASLSLIYVFNLYPLSFLAGKGYFFEEGDAAQHVTGWLFMLRTIGTFRFSRLSQLPKALA